MRQLHVGNSKIRMLVGRGCSRVAAVVLDPLPEPACRQELCDGAPLSISHCRNIQPLLQNLSFLLVFFLYVSESV